MARHQLSHPKIIQKLRSWIDAGDEQMIPGAGAGDVLQVAFGVVNFFQVTLAKLPERSNPSVGTGSIAAVALIGFL